MPRRSRFRTAGPTLFVAFLFLPSAPRALAQTDQPRPITALPKPASDTPAPATPAPESSVPADQIHPITSLPKPPVAAQPALPPPASLAPTPAASAAPPAAQPVATIPAQPSPAAGSQPDPTSVATPPVAQPAASVVPDAAPAPSPSSTPTLVAAPVVEPDMGPAPLRESTNLPLAPAPNRKRRADMRPFHSWAVQAKGGFAGFGVDVATSMTNHFNLRVGGSIFSYSGSYNADGITINGEVKFHTGNASIDYYPFKNLGLRLSAGIVYNGNNLNASTDVPGGQTFDLGDGTYTSDPNDPVHGTASLTFGHRIDPMFTIGFGNMIPRSGAHFSMPFEIGFQYTGTPPKLAYNLEGSACDAMGNCGPLASDPTAQADQAEELSDINSDITLLRFYPIISLGVAWKF